jgi:hypothetical protein
LSGLAAFKLKLCAPELRIPADHRNPQCAARSSWNSGGKIDLFDMKQLLLADTALAEFDGHRLPDFAAGDGSNDRSTILSGEEGANGESDCEKFDWTRMAEKAQVRIRASL